MAVYKVIQDIEAEDKLLGPLTLKGFIYAAVAGVCIFIEFRLLVAGGSGAIRGTVMVILLAPILLFGVLASPLGRDQPTEVWLLSHIRFLVKNRKRVWDQSGLSQLVTITVPKREERHLTKGFSQTEVQSRLQALATTLDSRGWSTKNATADIGAPAPYPIATDQDSDRLVGTGTLVQPAPVMDIHAADDILDEQNNATAQHFNELMKVADAQRKEAVIQKIEEARQSGAGVTASVDSRFLDKGPGTGDSTVFVGKAVVAPQTAQDGTTVAAAGADQPLTPELQAFLDQQHQRDAEIHRRIASFMPKNAPAPAPAVPQVPVMTSAQIAEAQKAMEAEKARQAIVTAQDRADKLELAQSGNDLSVASIAHLANRKNRIEQISPNEVVINLH